MSAEKTEGLKSYSWNAPRTYNSVYVVCPPRRTSFIPSCLLNHPLKPSKVSRFVTWKCIPSPENCIPLRFSCYWICECTAISNPQSVITDACYVSGYQNNLSYWEDLEGFCGKHHTFKLTSSDDTCAHFSPSQLRFHYFCSPSEQWAVPVINGCPGTG